MPPVRRQPQGATPPCTPKESAMPVEERLEIRITGEDKAALSRRAQAEGVSISTLMRRGIRSVLQRPGRLEPQDAHAIVVLRRRINILAARLDVVDGDLADIAAIRSDVAQAHTDAQDLLER